MNTLVLVGEEHSSTVVAEIARGTVPRIESLELARLLNADVLDYRDVARAAEPLVAAARACSPAWGLAVLAALRLDRYESVYVTGEDVGLPLALILRGLRRPRKITMVVHNSGSLSRRIAFPAVGRRAWRHLVCVCDRQRRVLIDELRCDPKLVHRLNLWIDTDFFAPGRSNSPEGEGYVLSCGRERRDYKTLLEAATGLSVPLRIVASGWSSRPGFRSATEVQSTAFARVDHGTLSHSQLREAYSGARFVVVPLDPVDYAAGISTICEAMAMGKAVIATASPGIAEYLEDGVSGLMVPPGDAETMARAIDELWRNPGRCEEMGRHNRRRAEVSLSLDGYVTAVAELMSS